MASSKIEIANIALVGLRAAIINSFTDETTEANAVNVIWDNVRATELAKHPYNFAIKRYFRWIVGEQKNQNPSGIVIDFIVFNQGIY